MTRPDKAAVRAEIALCLPFMGNDRERQAKRGQASLLRDARLWHSLSRTGGTRSFPAVECAAWAILYRCAFYGTLPTTGMRLLSPAPHPTRERKTP